MTRAASRKVTAEAEAAEQARVLAAGAAALLEGYSESLRRLEPIARQLAETTKPGEIDALATLLDRLPQPADAMDHEVIPMLGHLEGPPAQPHGQPATQGVPAA